MIPKIIHYCWFGGNPLPDSVQHYIKTWKQFCPDYEIIEWNENNFDLNCCPYVMEATKMKKWAFVSDYARLKIIYENGGIYLDTDVELLKPLDNLLTNKAFVGLEPPTNEIATGLGFGAEKGCLILKEIMEEYDITHFLNSDGSLNQTTCVKMTTKHFLKKGFDYNNTIQVIDGVTIYPTDYFCPMNWNNGKIITTENTYSIHHYDYSWSSEIERNIIIGKRNIQRRIPGLFGILISKIYSRSTRIVHRIKNKLH